MMMTESTGSVVWQGEFKPFGEPVSVSGSVTNNLRFPGQYYDSETGLQQNYYRDYKPDIGRYVEVDPIGSDRGKNHLYIYTLNNPINLTDPLGLDVMLCARQGVLFSDLGREHGFYVIPHCYIAVGGRIFSWNWAFGGGIHGNENPGNNSCGKVKCCGDESAFENCVITKAVAAKGNEGNLWIPAVHDCCTWAHKIVGECRRKHCKG